MWILIFIVLTPSGLLETDSGNHFATAAECNRFWDSLYGEKVHYECRYEVAA